MISLSFFVINVSPIFNSGEVIVDIYRLCNKCFDIKYFISWASKITYDVSNYNKKWKSPKCIQDNHNIQYYSEYKPIGICHNCSIVQSFCYEPWMSIYTEFDI